MGADPPNHNDLPDQVLDCIDHVRGECSPVI